MRSSNRKSKRNVLLLKSGDVAPPLSLWAGDYDRWFAAAFGPDRIRMTVVQAHRNQKIPDGRSFDAVVMSGSSLSVTQPQPWMDRAAERMLDAAEAGVPVLGVCFGHQLLSRALGGRVLQNPLGRETGSVTVHLTGAGQKDPLFQGLPDAFVVQATHGDIVELPRGATVLASNANTRVQAAAFAKNIRGVQFHPELTVHGVKALIASREASLAAGGANVTHLKASLSPAPYARQILFNFLEQFC